MTSTLPTIRDLPPERHAEIRAELERVVSRPARRSWLVPATATAAAIGIVFAAMLFLRTGGSESVPPATGREGQPEPPPGVTLAERAEIEKSCAERSDVSPEYRLYNLVSGDAGRFALLIGDTGNLTCSVDSPHRFYSELGSARDSESTPVVIDQSSRAPEADAVPAFDMVLGRVRSDIAKVTMTMGERTVDAVLANGTFMALMTHTDYRPPKDARVYLNGYDAEGNLLGTVNTHAATPGECSVLPDDRFMVESGVILPDLPEYRGDTPNCPPANPWR